MLPKDLLVCTAAHDPVPVFPSKGKILDKGVVHGQVMASHGGRMQPKFRQETRTTGFAAPAKTASAMLN